MESLAGVEISRFPANRISFFLVNVLPFSLMAVFGMDANSIVGCHKSTVATGKIKLPGMRYGIERLGSVCEKLAGEFSEYGNILSRHRLWQHNASNRC